MYSLRLLVLLRIIYHVGFSLESQSFDQRHLPVWHHFLRWILGWQIGEMESWLSDMAEEGLILKIKLISDS